MNWAIHLLGSHPEVQKKAQQELFEVFGALSPLLVHIIQLNNKNRCFKSLFLCEVKEPVTVWKSFE